MKVPEFLFIRVLKTAVIFFSFSFEAAPSGKIISNVIVVLGQNNSNEEVSDVYITAENSVNSVSVVRCFCFGANPRLIVITGLCNERAWCYCLYIEFVCVCVSLFIFLIFIGIKGTIF